MLRQLLVAGKPDADVIMAPGVVEFYLDTSMSAFSMGVAAVPDFPAVASGSSSYAVLGSNLDGPLVVHLLPTSVVSQFSAAGGIVDSAVAVAHSIPALVTAGYFLFAATSDALVEATTSVQADPTVIVAPLPEQAAQVDAVAAAELSSFIIGVVPELDAIHIMYDVGMTPIGYIQQAAAADAYATVELTGYLVTELAAALPDAVSGIVTASADSYLACMASAEVQPLGEFAAGAIALPSGAQRIDTAVEILAQASIGGSIYVSTSVAAGQSVGYVLGAPYIRRHATTPPITLQAGVSANPLVSLIVPDPGIASSVTLPGSLFSHSARFSFNATTIVGSTAAWDPGIDSASLVVNWSTNNISTAQAVNSYGKTFQYCSFSVGTEVGDTSHESLRDVLNDPGADDGVANIFFSYYDNHGSTTSDIVLLCWGGYANTTSGAHHRRLVLTGSNTLKLEALANGPGSSVRSSVTLTAVDGLNTAAQSTNVVRLRITRDDVSISVNNNISSKSIPYGWGIGPATPVANKVMFGVLKSTSSTPAAAKTWLGEVLTTTRSPNTSLYEADARRLFTGICSRWLSLVPAYGTSDVSAGAVTVLANHAVQRRSSVLAQPSVTITAPVTVTYADASWATLGVTKASDYRTWYLDYYNSVQALTSTGLITYMANNPSWALYTGGVSTELGGLSHLNPTRLTGEPAGYSTNGNVGRVAEGAVASASAVLRRRPDYSGTAEPGLQVTVDGVTFTASVGYYAVGGEPRIYLSYVNKATSSDYGMLAQKPVTSGRTVGDWCVLSLRVACQATDTGKAYTAEVWQGDPRRVDYLVGYKTILSPASALPSIKGALRVASDVEYAAAILRKGPTSSDVLAVHVDLWRRWGLAPLATGELPPSPPTALRAVTGFRTMDLTWGPSPTPGVTYSIYNGSTLVAEGVTDTSYTLSGLTPSKTYTVTVAAVTAGGRDFVTLTATTLATPTLTFSQKYYVYDVTRKCYDLMLTVDLSPASLPSGYTAVLTGAWYNSDGSLHSTISPITRSYPTSAGTSSVSSVTYPVSTCGHIGRIFNAYVELVRNKVVEVQSATLQSTLGVTQFLPKGPCQAMYNVSSKGYNVFSGLVGSVYSWPQPPYRGDISEYRIFWYGPNNDQLTEITSSSLINYSVVDGPLIEVTLPGVKAGQVCNIYTVPAYSIGIDPVTGLALTKPIYPGPFPGCASVVLIPPGRSGPATGLTVTKPSPEVYRVTPSITLSWTAPSNAAQAGVTQYLIKIHDLSNNALKGTYTVIPDTLSQTSFSKVILCTGLVTSNCHLLTVIPQANVSGYPTVDGTSASVRYNIAGGATC